MIGFFTGLRCQTESETPRLQVLTTDDSLHYEFTAWIATTTARLLFYADDLDHKHVDLRIVERVAKL